MLFHNLKSLFEFKIFYSNSKNIYLIFFKKKLNSEHCYSNMKTDISILKILVSILKIIFEPGNGYSNSETFIRI
jgi:hypothetical protein